MTEKLTEADGWPYSAEYVRERFNYYPATGILTWRTSHHFTKVGKPVGWVGTHGYLVANLNNLPELVHRIIWIHVYGRAPVDEIDHVNRIRTDNRIANLREATRSQQLMNQGVRSDNVSGFRGVSWDRSRRKYLARISVNRKVIDLGRFDRLDDAVAKRQSAELFYFGKFIPQEDVTLRRSGESGGTSSEMASQ